MCDPFLTHLKLLFTFSAQKTQSSKMQLSLYHIQYFEYYPLSFAAEKLKLHTQELMVASQVRELCSVSRDGGEGEEERGVLFTSYFPGS